MIKVLTSSQNTFVALFRPARVAAWAIFAVAIPQQGHAEAGVYSGSLQPMRGARCEPASDVSIRIDGSRLSFTTPSTSGFSGTVQRDGSFHLLPAHQQIVDKRMLAPPVLEGTVSGDVVTGVVTSRWCNYRVVARKVNSSLSTADVNPH